MTLVAERLEALIVARAHAAKARLALGELVAPLVRFAPAEQTPAAWCDQLAEVAAGLQAQGVIDADHRPRDPGELVRRLGGSAARSWPVMSDRVLPGLALGIAVGDAKRQARLDSRDAWAAAIVGRALGVWRDGPPLSLPAMCDALVWRELGLPGKPKRCPAELRALFVQRRLGSEAGPPERLVRVLAAREVDAPRSELRALRDALVRGWLAGRTPGAPAPEPFAEAVRRAAGEVVDGWFGDRKVFVSAVWDQLRKDPQWVELGLAGFKAQLLAAHRAGELSLARADLVAAMDPALVAASEIIADGASFHFLVQERAA
jgi:hypothetical protein